MKLIHPQKLTDNNSSEAANAGPSSMSTIAKMKRSQVTASPDLVGDQSDNTSPGLSANTTVDAPGPRPPPAAPAADELMALEERIALYAQRILDLCSDSEYESDSDDESSGGSGANKDGGGVRRGPTSAPSITTAPAPTNSVQRTSAQPTEDNEACEAASGMEVAPKVLNDFAHGTGDSAWKRQNAEDGVQAGPLKRRRS